MRVRVVDDSSMDRIVVARLLTDLGHELLNAPPRDRAFRSRTGTGPRLSAGGRHRLPGQALFRRAAGASTDPQGNLRLVSCDQWRMQMDGELDEEDILEAKVP